MGAPNGNTFMWTFVCRSKDLPQSSHDLTRRGGVVLNEKQKVELDALVANRGDLIRLAIQETPASSITPVGLYDRQNLKLPYTQGGDVHPQTPFMGQGVNQTITDAYVCAMRLSREPSVTAALQAYDSPASHKGVNQVIQKARSYGECSVSSNRLVC